MRGDATGIFTSKYRRSQLFQSSAREKVFKEKSELGLTRLKNEKTLVDTDVKKSLLPQSIHGMALGCNGPFENYEFKDVDFDDVCIALEMDPLEEKRKRQVLVERVKPILDTLLQKKPVKLDFYHNEPVYGVDFLRSIEITDPKAALKGFAIAGYMDTMYWRKETMNEYILNLGGSEFTLGYGEQMIINKEMYGRLGVSRLAQNVISDSYLDYLKEEGVVVKDAGARGTTTKYVRRREGLGVCDDAAIATIGKLYGIDAMIMAFVNDATDTYEKAIETPKAGGFDTAYADFVTQEWRRRYHEDLVTPSEITRVIYLGAKNNAPYIPFSSSHRRFCVLEGNAELPTFVNHVGFVQGLEHTPGFSTDFKIGFSKLKAGKFYSALENRWELYDKQYGTNISEKNAEERHPLLEKTYASLN